MPCSLSLSRARRAGVEAQGEGARAPLERETEPKKSESRCFTFLVVSFSLSSSRHTMQHFAAANTRTQRERRTQPAQQQYDFMDSDSEDDDEAPPRRGAGAGGAGGRLRPVGDAQAAAAGAPRDAAAVVEDIKQAVSRSLRQSSQREWGLVDEVTIEREKKKKKRERGIRSIRPGRLVLTFFSSKPRHTTTKQKQTYDQLLENLLSVGESLKLAGAPHDAVIGAAEKLLAVQRGSLRRSTALLLEAQDYNPSRFVAGNGENEEPAAAAAAGAGGAGDATDFAAKLSADAAGGRSGRRRARAREARSEASGCGDGSDDGSDDSVGGADEAEALCTRARDALADLRQQEDRLNELRGFAPEQQRRRRARGDDDEVMEVRGGDAGGGAGAGRDGTMAGARNARCPLTTKLLAEIDDPVEDAGGFVYERAVIEGYVLSETAKRSFGGGRRGGATAAMPAPGAAASEYRADVVARATSEGVLAPVAGTNHMVSLGTLRPARRLLRELAARRARAAAAGGGGWGGRGEEGAGAGAYADIDISL